VATHRLVQMADADMNQLQAIAMKKASVPGRLKSCGNEQDRAQMEKLSIATGITAAGGNLSRLEADDPTIEELPRCHRSRKRRSGPKCGG